MYWGTNDPKSLWAGTDRIVKDRAYDQSLNKLTTRIGNGPGLHQDDTGFRLVTLNPFRIHSTTRIMKSTKPAALTGILSLLLLGPSGQAKRESANYAIGVEVIGGLAGPSASASFSNFGVNEPITGLSLKDLPDVRNFAGFVGGVVPLDQDQDGLHDHQEVALGTDPGMSDTDGDGLTDKEEVDLGTNPLVADSDGDRTPTMPEFLAQTDPKDASDSPNALPVYDANQSLSIAENQPAGAVVGHLLASDADGHALTFGIADGPGDADNLFFSLDANGTVVSQKSFDFESEPTLSFRARVEDGNGGSVEASFTVSVTNLIEDLDGDGIEDAYDLDDDGDGLIDAMEVSTHGPTRARRTAMGMPLTARRWPRLPIL